MAESEMERFYSEYTAQVIPPDLSGHLLTFQDYPAIFVYWFHWPKYSLGLVSSLFPCVFPCGSTMGYYRPFIPLQRNLSQVKHKTISSKYTYI